MRARSESRCLAWSIMNILQRIETRGRFTQTGIDPAGN
jgi:hypothetical protein